jgi:hypothetical protein
MTVIVSPTYLLFLFVALFVFLFVIFVFPFSSLVVTGSVCDTYTCPSTASNCVVCRLSRGR